MHKTDRARLKGTRESREAEEGFQWTLHEIVPGGGDASIFWKWRLNVVAVVLAGGALGLFRAFAPGLFGGGLS